MKILQKDSIIKKCSGIEGNTTVIMVGVHGNELAGPQMLPDLIEKLEIIKGTVYFIFANLQALEKNVRFVEKNMNRCFLENISGISYEEKRAYELMKILKDSDYLLDVHNTLNKNNSIPFLISEYSDLGKYFDVHKVVSGLDFLHPGGSDGYMNSIGKVGICLEAGNIYDKKGPEIAKKGIINFLKYTGNISGIPKKYEQQTNIFFDTIYKNTSLDFRFVKEFLDFERVKRGQLIAIDGEREIISNRNGYIIFTYNPEKIGDEVFCLGK